jgi:multiple sugar transport system substrate-binding protein
MTNKRLSRRDFLRLAAGTASVAVLAACGPSAAPAASSSASSQTGQGSATTTPQAGTSSGTSSGAAPAAAGVNVQWWFGWGGTVALDTLKKVVDDFNAQNMGFQVTPTQVPSISDKLLTAIAGGTPPDVETGNISYTQFYALDSMLPLTDRIDASKIDQKDIFASSWTAASWKGVIYGVPSVESFLRYGFSVNDALVKAKGLDPTSLPQTFDDALTWAKELTQTDKAGNVQILGFDPLDAMGGSWGGGDPCYWGKAYDTDFFDPQTGTFHLDEDWFVETLTTIKQYYDIVGADKITGFHNSFGTWTESPTSAFPSGVEAMIINGYWQPGELAHSAPDKTFSYGWALVPANRKGTKIQSTGGHNSQIPKGAAHPDEAFQYIEYLISPKAMTDIFNGTGWLGASQSFLSQVDTSKYSGLDFYVKSATAADKMYGLIPNPIDGFTATQWTDTYNAVNYGTKTAKQAAADMQKALTDQYNKQFGSS